MKITPLILTGAMALSFLGCKEKTASESRHPKPAVEGKAAQAPPVGAVSDTFKAALGKVYGGYGQIHGALAQDDFPKAKEALAPMHAILHMMPTEGLGPSAKAAWDSLDTRIMATLHPMASAESIDSVRSHFMEFSSIMLKAIETFGMNGVETVYRFHCPRAMDARGADWLQSDGELRNPYLGKRPPACGDLVGTIKGDASR